MPQVKTAPDDELVRRLVPGKVRVTISVYDTEGIPRSYRFVPGHSEIREVQNLREFRRLWRALKAAMGERREWRDIDRALSGAGRASGANDSPRADRAIHTGQPTRFSLANENGGIQRTPPIALLICRLRVPAAASVL